MKGIKTTLKQFETFKKECEYYQHKWKLDDWKISYAVEDLRGRGECTRTLDGCMVTISFCKYYTDQINLLNDDEIKEIAKHEMLHVLLGRLGSLAYTRFTNADEIQEAEHALLHKLMKLL